MIQHAVHRSSVELLCNKEPKRRPYLPSRRFVTAAIVVVGTSCSSSAPPGESDESAQPVVTDGRFGEWQSVPVLINDPADDAPGASVDLGRIQSASDGRFLYFTLETGGTVNAQAMHGSVSVLLDADDDPDTGVTTEGLPGVDLVLELSRRDQVNPEGFGSGMAIRVRTLVDTLSERANPSEFDLLVAPTFSTDRFELRVRRGLLSLGGSPLLVGTSARVRFVFAESESRPGRSEEPRVDRTDAAVVALAPFEDGSGSPWSAPLPPPAGDVRVLVWNVSSESFRDRADRFARVIAAANPDVLLLDEVFGDVSPAHIADFLAKVGADLPGAWTYVLGTSGGRQKTLVASRRGLQPEPSLQNLPYPAGSLEELQLRFPFAERLFDLERERGLASVGAWVDVAGHPVLFVPVDLQSAGYDGSVQDELRKLQASTLRNYVTEALRRDGRDGSVVVGGDLNLVGSRTPLDLLSEGLDRGSDLAPVDTYRLTDRSMATWRNPRLQFTPGRLDFVLVPQSSLIAENAFALDGGELSDEVRAALGLDPDDFNSTSDHLPLVVDLRYKGVR